ncbi:hypothetical protein [Novipirellula sp.]|uniref:hypothetical protein n=1 Tax=Novipirellula sp. TaxID=2795430 RepID=UPI003565386C
MATDEYQAFDTETADDGEVVVTGIEQAVSGRKTPNVLRCFISELNNPFANRERQWASDTLREEWVDGGERFQRDTRDITERFEPSDRRVQLAISPLCGESDLGKFGDAG